MLFVCHSRILHKHCLQFLLRVKMAPRETGNNAYAKFGVTKKEHYGMLWYFLKWSIAHTCCDQVTAVKTGSPLTSITWPHRGLKFWPIEVMCLLEVFSWQVFCFELIAGSRLFFFFNAHRTWNKLCLWASGRNSDAKSQPFLTAGDAVAVELSLAL